MNVAPMPGGEQREPYPLGIASVHGNAYARCSIWWRQTPTLQGERVGLIGHYDANDMGAAAELLDQASRRLAGLGCTLAIGPMDGSSWHPYRLVSAHGKEPAFFLEPDTPAAWLTHFQRAGFSMMAGYQSVLQDTLTATGTDDALEHAMRAAGVSIEPFAEHGVDRMLVDIHTVCEVAFRRNLLFTPMPRAGFVALYRPLLGRIEPAMTLIARQSGRPVGFVFCVPDWLRLAREGRRDTVIVKTLAILPRRELRGLGKLLLQRALSIAHARGYARAILALIREGTRSNRLSAGAGVVMRRYALLSRRLSA